MPIERPDQRLRRLSADAIIDDVGAVAVRQLADLGLEIGSRKQDHVVGARGFGNRSLLF